MFFFSFWKGSQTGFDPPNVWVGTPGVATQSRWRWISWRDTGISDVTSPTKGGVCYTWYLPKMICANVCSVNCSPMKYGNPNDVYILVATVKREGEHPNVDCF